MMGGRGARFGASVKGNPYGAEYKTILQVGRIKFIIPKDGKPSSAPFDTQSKGRIYVTINSKGEPAYISLYRKGKRVRQIDLLHSHKELKGPHTHRGYYHDENGSRPLYKRERELVDFVRTTWHNNIQR